jgi:hypothetical protein
MTNDPNGSAGPMDLENSAAVLRFEVQDLDALLRALAERLSSVPGLKIEVSYRRGRLRRLIGDIPYVNDLHRPWDPIHRMVITIGANAYWVQSTDGVLTSGIDTLTLQRGPASDPLLFPAWADLLIGEIVSQNHISHESALALRNLIEGERA